MILVAAGVVWAAYEFFHRRKSADIGYLRHTDSELGSAIRDMAWHASQIKERKGMSEATEKDELPTACPKCGEPIGFNLISKIKDQHRYVIKMTPGDGHFSTKTIGGVITQIGRFGNSLAKDIGVKTQTLVERITTDEDGTITVYLLTSIVRGVGAPTPRAPEL